ncbi:hypothetical protein K9M74_04845 [Candidatus Woesearchaeota archaeon]|nr:hypothetical protein [Candidatus Woesearchaeota archaeon]
MNLPMDEAQEKVKTFVNNQNWQTESSEIFNHLVEEIGEVARELRTSNKENLSSELADTLFLLFKLANHEEINLEDAFIEKFKIIQQRFK